MNGRRAVIGLSLLCALVSCAFAAPSAQALQGTTAFTCEPVVNPPKTTKGFSDEHCLTAAEGEKVKFEHKEIEVGLTTETTGTNEKTKNETKESTSATLTGTLAGVTLEVTCKKVHSHGSLKNETPGSQMTVGGIVTVTYTECEVLKPKGCTVTEPIVAEATAMSQVNAAEEMFVEFKGKGAEETFATLEIGVCAIKGKYPVKGTVVGTPNGATVDFKAKEKGNTLQIGGKEANYVGQETVRMTGGNPIVLTTTAN